MGHRSIEREGNPTILDEALDKLEEDPRFIEAMKASERDIRARRVVSLEEVRKRYLRRRTSNRRTR